MASFTDKFEYANDNSLASVTTGAWLEADATPTTAQGVKVLQKGCTNLDTLAARAVYQTTVPTTVQQEAAAWVTSLEESATAFVEIGVGALQVVTTGFTTDVLGVYARLLWAADGVRTLSIRHRLRGGTDTEAETINLTTAGAVEPEEHKGKLVEAGAVGALQLLRLVVTTDDYGMWARAYVNTDSDDEPSLIARIRSDFISATATLTDYGAWWFGFGTSTATEKLFLTNYYGADYATTDIVQQTLREDQVTLPELRKRVRSRYEKTANTSLTDDNIDNHLRDEVEQILNEIGDAAWFMHRVESVAMTPNSVTGEVTLDSKMRNVLGLRVTSTGRPERFVFRRLTTDGAPVIAVGSREANTYDVTYRLRHQQMQDDTDQCPIPREHTELVVVGACVRLAEIDRNKGVLDSLLARRTALWRLFMRDQHRYADQTRQTMIPRRQGPVYRRRFYLQRWGY